MKLSTPLGQALYDSPLRRTGGKVAFVAIFAILFAAALPAFGRYYFQAPMQMLAALPVMILLYLPWLLILWYLDRREREPRLFFFGAALLVTFFLGPVTSQMLKYSTAMGLPTVRIVGFIEDFWKVVPLLLLIIFARASVNGVRDGMIYGALGGFGFSVLEGAAYFAMVFYPRTDGQRSTTPTPAATSSLPTNTSSGAPLWGRPRLLGGLQATGTSMACADRCVCARGGDSLPARRGGRQDPGNLRGDRRLPDPLGFGDERRRPRGRWDSVDVPCLARRHHQPSGTRPGLSDRAVVCDPPARRHRAADRP